VLKRERQRPTTHSTISQTRCSPRSIKLSFQTKSSSPRNLNAPAENWRNAHLSAELSDNSHVFHPEENRDDSYRCSVSPAVSVNGHLFDRRGLCKRVHSPKSSDPGGLPASPAASAPCRILRRAGLRPFSQPMFSAITRNSSSMTTSPRFNCSTASLMP
jgi:hypothetical protein